MNTSPPASLESLFVHGYGCVSSAGIGAEATYKACVNQQSIPEEVRDRGVGDESVVSLVRPVDSVALRAAMPKHPRLRRASNVSKFAITAASEALGDERIEKIQNGEIRLGIVLAFINGCVNYSNRFYAEALANPSLASPILFPETVFNAPASHVASYLKSDGPVYTLIGDSAGWFSSIKIARDWLDSGQVDGCLVLCAEELDWLVTEAFSLYAGELHGTEGAAAIYLEKGASDIQLEAMHGPFDYTSTAERSSAIHRAWEGGAAAGDGLLIDGLTGVEKLDRCERKTLGNWVGSRVSPAVTLGYGAGASCGFQTVVALEALKEDYSSSIVMASGTNQHAFSARFNKTNL